MNKLITGGTGLIGSEFETGIKVASKDFDLRVQSCADQLFSEYRPDHVIHTAAKVGGVLANTNFVYDFYLDNIRINTNVIDAARTHNVKKLIAFTSTCVFPNQVEYPLRENQLHQGPPHQSNYGYAYAKRMADVQIQSCNQQYGTKYFTVIPTNIYGPRDNYDLDNGHVLPSLIHRCYLAHLQQTDFEVWGDGSPMREFVFSRDIAKICDILLDRYNDTTPVIVSNSQEYSIKQLVEMIISVIGYRGKVRWNINKPLGQHRKPTDNSNLRSIIGNYKFVSMQHGLEETISYFIENYKNVRK
jgi:GDP-L-fucose synthase